MEDEKENKEDKKTELGECQKKCNEYLNGWKRAAADFANYKKEEYARAQELMRYAKESFLESLLPMLDNLVLTEKNLSAELKNDANVKGLLMVKTQLEDFLKSHGVAAVESLGANFDPALHEVIQAVEAQGRKSGIIIEEVQRGYTVNGRLLRPAKVKTAK